MSCITIQSIGNPDGKSVNDALKWLCQSLGIFSQRDKDNSCYRVFIELLKASRQGKALSSDELSAKLGIVRGTVVHHLNRLMDSGLVVVEDSRYGLKKSNLKALVADVKVEVCKTLDKVEKVASKIDNSI